MGLVSWLSRGTSGLTPEAGAESTGLCVTGGLTPRHTDALPRGHDLCDSEDDTDPPSLFPNPAQSHPSPTACQSFSAWAAGSNHPRRFIKPLDQLNDVSGGGTQASACFRLPG